MRFTKCVPVIGALLLLLAGTGCDANRVTDLPSSEPTPADNRATVIRLTPDTATLAVGDIIGLSARVFDTDGYEITGGDIQWRLSAKAKVRLAADGTLEGIAEGEDTVYASLDGATSSSVFRVREPRVASISITINPAAVEVGGPARASAVLRKADGTVVGGRIYWYSTNTAVATIDQEGNINTRRPGTTQIRGIAEGKLDSKTLSVIAGEEAPAVASITVSSSVSTIYIGRTTRLTAMARDAAGNALTGAPIVWSSSSNLIATINSTGDATGMGGGSVTFTATSGGAQGQKAMSVTQVPVDAIALQLIPATVTVGGSAQAQATTYDADGEVLSGRSVSFASSNTAVATVTQTGAVSTHSAGNATITATSEGKSSSAALTVNSTAPVPVATVSVSLVDNSLEPGQTTQALATARDAGGVPLTGRVVTWASSNTAVATVNSSGLVTAVSVGNANIIGTSEGRNGSAAVGVTASTPPPPPAPTVTYFGINPSSASLLFGGTQQFQHAVSWSDGATRAILVTYSANGGTVTAGGLYTAGQTAGAFRLIATCDCGLADTVAINISAPPQQTPLLTGVEVTPPTTTLSVGQTQAFSATGRYSNGTTGPVSVNWSATGGGITSQGIYTAGQSAGSFLVIAMCACGFSDTSVVAVTNPQQTTIAAMTLDPSSATLAPGQAYQFTANGWPAGSDQPIVAPAVWSATGGTVDQTGRYVAGNTAGTYIVRAQSTQISWGRDSSVITITSSGSTPPPAPVASVSVSLGSSSRTVGQTTQATATLRDASNNVLTGSVAWSSTNTAVATVSSGGLVTAVGAGSASIRGTSGGITGSATLTVTAASVAPVATVSVSLASSSIPMATVTQASATLRDAVNNILSGRIVTWSSSNPLVAAVTPLGLVTGLLTGSATITATSEGRTGSATITVTAALPPPPPGAVYANKPSNYNVILDDGFDWLLATAGGCCQDTGKLPSMLSWGSIYNRGTMSIVQGQGGLDSPTNALEWKYNAGGISGEGVGSLYRSLPSNTKEIYIAFSLKHSSNFEWHGISNKLLYLEPGNVILQSKYQSKYLSVWNGGTVLENWTGSLKLGVWQRVEYLLNANTKTVKIWLDGVLVNSGSLNITGNWQELMLSSTWGGTGGARTRDSWRWVDHIVIAIP